MLPSAWLHTRVPDTRSSRTNSHATTQGRRRPRGATGHSASTRITIGPLTRGVPVDSLKVTTGGPETISCIDVTPTGSNMLTQRPSTPSLANNLLQPTYIRTTINKIDDTTSQVMMPYPRSLSRPTTTPQPSIKSVEGDPVAATHLRALFKRARAQVPTKRVANTTSR